MHDLAAKWISLMKKHNIASIPKVSYYFSCPSIVFQLTSQHESPDLLYYELFIENEIEMRNDFETIKKMIREEFETMTFDYLIVYGFLARLCMRFRSYNKK